MMKNSVFCSIILMMFLISITLAGHVHPPCTDEPPPKCPKNEYYDPCGCPCQTTCDTLEEECDIVNIKCPSACYCIDGYARDDYGTCIPIEECCDHEHIE